MFESISAKIAKTFKNLRGLGKITEKNISEALQELRLALIDADVNIDVVDNLIENVKQKSLGQEVLAKIAPEQQIVKIIYDEIVSLFGDEEVSTFTEKRPVKILLVGLHGAGKTTTAAKLAFLLSHEHYSPLLVACDVQRPAAIDQLETLAKNNNFPFFAERDQKNLSKIANHALSHAKSNKLDAIIFDSAGRLQIDNDLIEQVKELQKTIKPDETLLVADSATGQEATNVAKVFNEALHLSGIILTKMDGDARAGAALSMKSVTGVPIRLLGTGEHVNDLELLRPKRLAQRILGMGDVVSLVEKAKQQVDEKEQKRLGEKIKKAKFDLEDFLQSIQQIQKLGPLSSLIKMLPGAAGMSASTEDNDKLRQIRAIIQSMTVQERRKPSIIDQHRRLRIARGAGVEMRDVNSLLKQFTQMQKMMKSFKGEKGLKNMKAFASQFGLASRE